MRSRNRTISLAVALAGAVIALAGCGGGSATLSKADFIRQADAICAATTAKVNALPQLGSSATTSQVVASVQQALAVVDPALNQLAALHAAPADFAVLNKNLLIPTRGQDQAAHTLITQMQQDSGNTAAQQTAIEKFSAAASNPDQTTQDNALAAFGFAACSKTNQSS